MVFPINNVAKGVPNMILVKVICFVNVENHFLKFTMYITFTRIMLGTPLYVKFMNCRSIFYPHNG